MHTLADMAGLLNRSTVYLSGLQKRFELPACEGVAYPDAYLEFFRTVMTGRDRSFINVRPA